ncbi:hypothetical protein NCPPB3923_18275 [Burkholderia glumae]|nr:hypothetical protein NCPPB3923_18275 [Burkholderia glumae]
MRECRGLVKRITLERVRQGRGLRSGVDEIRRYDVAGEIGRVVGGEFVRGCDATASDCRLRRIVEHARPRIREIEDADFLAVLQAADERNQTDRDREKLADTPHHPAIRLLR